MQIFCIVVYEKNSTRPSITLPHQLIQEKHARLILRMWPDFQEQFEAQTGIRRIILHEQTFKLADDEDYQVKQDEYFYGLITPKNNIIIALDQPINLHAQLALYQTIVQGTDNDETQLQWIMQHPLEAIKNKFDTIQTMLEEVKEVSIRNIDKLIERGEKIEVLLERTEQMKTETLSFKKAARRLHNSYLCPGLFSFYQGIVNFFTKPKIEHEFQPIDQKSRLWKLK